ncbi:Sur7p NDAI_0D01410 [Naumovozyma dairenensis CBS 421]|uniref:Protein SUR7 n=1 Tax=Naumovozyma dairenensis (strain ATCC 10597 / BCRC 20456 / CBS 421 / NBRC 0211 / NRRL Y-12639) TaxID=1071378 RepID=G0W9J4_NAUDC|nr:hypothetical protein NDAI_0D01410 [Naumovozyma dairenensis CBS 421]CCD24455.1 hypothetical protein NDAI_0D01410 [Naumovozyma dairenensis CBS 421]
MRRSLSITLRLLGLLFFAGNTLLLILIIISGTTRHYPVDRFYWVQGDTSGIPNAPNLTRWTYWGACERLDGVTHCSGNLAPAYPISPVDNFNTKVNVPSKFISNRDAFYYLTRFSFCFFWIALAFIGITFILYIFSWCSSIMLKIIFILMIFGFIFNITSVVLQTAASVMARNAFHDADRSASVGASLMGIAWASVTLCFLELGLTTYWFTTNEYNATFSSTPHLEHRHNKHRGFFHRKKDPMVDRTLNSPIPTSTAADPYAFTPNPNINATITNNNASSFVPPPQETTHKGINFFKIRRTQHLNDDDSL